MKWPNSSIRTCRTCTHQTYMDIIKREKPDMLVFFGKCKCSMHSIEGDDTCEFAKSVVALEHDIVRILGFKRDPTRRCFYIYYEFSAQQRFYI